LPHRNFSFLVGRQVRPTYQAEPKEAFMPKVKLLTSMAGIDFSHNSGDIIDCNEAEAVRFVKAGIAEAIAAPASKVERAVKKTVTRKAISEE
tara:strand:+ start:1834 stop:2109 length:276 start_codon:yes stop_codon:yes gene_type:complete